MGRLPLAIALSLSALCGSAQAQSIGKVFTRVPTVAKVPVHGPKIKTPGLTPLPSSALSTKLDALPASQRRPVPPGTFRDVNVIGRAPMPRPRSIIAP